MYDCGFYPRDAILALQAHWQKTQGVPDHKPRMKDAGIKARDKHRANKAAAQQVEPVPPLLTKVPDLA